LLFVGDAQLIVGYVHLWWTTVHPTYGRTRVHSVSCDFMKDEIATPIIGGSPRRGCPARMRDKLGTGNDVKEVGMRVEEFANNIRRQASRPAEDVPQGCGINWGQAMTCFRHKLRGENEDLPEKLDKTLRIK